MKRPLPPEEETMKNALAERMAAFVHPVWVEDDQHNPQQVGSCALLKVGDRVFLLTAAHVLDENAATTIFLVTSAGPATAQGTKHASVSPSGDLEHKDDPCDVAVLSLSAEAALRVSPLPSLCLDQCDVNATPMPSSLYFACGYPWTKNRKVDTRRAKLPRRPFAYFTKTHPPATYESLGKTWGVHFVVDYNKRHVIQQGRDITGPDLPGVSGGLLWCSKGLSHRVVGVITGWPTERNLTKSIVAIHIRYFLNAIREVYPEVAAEIPEVTFKKAKHPEP